MPYRIPVSRIGVNTFQIFTQPPVPYPSRVTASLALSVAATYVSSNKDSLPALYRKSSVALLNTSSVVLTGVTVTRRLDRVQRVCKMFT